MQRYFITSEEKNTELITGEKYHHIVNVMRAKINDEIELSYDGVIYLSKIIEINNASLKYSVIDQYYFDSEFMFNVTILQGYPKGDKIDDIIKHSTELGVNKIIPALMERSIVKLDENKRQNRKERLQKIALEASMQSKRNVVPIIGDIVGLNKIDYSEYNIKILAYEEEAKNENNNFTTIIKSLKKNDNVIIAIGPEGGFSNNEVDYLKSKGFVACSLGKRILRTETASLYVLSAIGYEFL